MPEVTASSIVDVRLGTQMVGALMAGNREIYVRFEKRSFTTPGTFSFTLPSWASGYGVLLSGGGAGGRAGNGGNTNRGNGGQGGDIFAIWGKLGSSSDRVLSGTIGAGGNGGTSSHAYGQNGGVTTVINHVSNVYSAAGGVGNPTMTTQAGGTKATVLTDPFHKFLNSRLDSYYYNGPAGSGNGGTGQRGGGGAGGNGGIFNNYTRGGKGGNGFVDIYVWGMPPDEMRGWETVQITLGTGSQTRDQLRAALADRGLDYRTVIEIPFDIELVGSGSAQDMFNGCASLTTVPDMDTSRVTNMSYMFSGCSSLTTVPDMDTSRVTIMGGMFSGCSSLTTVPDMDSSQVTNMSYMFNQCASLTTVPDMDTSRVTNMIAMFQSCSSLTHVPDMDTSQVTNMSYMFNNCSSLTDGNVRLIGKHPDVTKNSLISSSGLTREPFYDTNGNPI